MSTSRSFVVHICSGCAIESKRTDDHDTWRLADNSRGLLASPPCVPAFGLTEAAHASCRCDPPRRDDGSGGRSENFIASLPVTMKLHRTHYGAKVGAMARGHRLARQPPM